MRSQFQVDPRCFETGESGREIEVVVPYTGADVTGAVLERALALTAGLDATITLVAVHAVPYPSSFSCPAAVHAHLVEQLLDLAGRCPLPVNPLVVLARSREDGFRHALKPGSTVLVGTRRHFWRTPEEKLARALARDGHNVALVHIA